MSTYTFVVISPATTTRPVVISVSQATRPSGSSARTASSTESEIWSATLSGCPSVTDSEVNENERAPINETLASFVGRTPPHQLTCELVQGTALEHRADTLGDRQLDPQPPGEVAQHRRRRQPLDHLADLGQRLARRGTARHQLARAAIAAVRMPARDDEVAHAGEARERVRVRAERLAQPRHLDEPARDQRRLRVVAEPEPVDRARCERDHVLRSRAELDADEIVVDVDAEREAAQLPLQQARE